jgi:hypothetical protein
MMEESLNADSNIESLKERLKSYNGFLSRQKLELREYAEKLRKFKLSDRMNKAAQVMTKRRYKQTKRKIKKSLTGLSTVVPSIKKRGDEFFRRKIYTARINRINKKIDGLLSQLGCEVYDLESQSAGNTNKNRNIVSIMSQADKYHKEIAMIEKKCKGKEY